MTNFITDDTDLDFPKIDQSVLAPAADAAQYVLSENWNKTCQALVDVKGMLRGAPWFGIATQTTDPQPAAISDYIWVSNTGILTVKRGGVNYQTVNTARLVGTGTGILGGGALNQDLFLELEPITPDPSGSFSRADIVVDAYGRVLSASSNTGASAYALMQNGVDLLPDHSVLHVDGDVLTFEDDGTNGWTHLRLLDTAVVPGPYTYANITVDAQGRLTAAASGAAPALASLVLTAGVGLSGGGDLTAPRTFDLEDTVVTPGSYVYAGFTVDQQGRITAAASGSAPALSSVTLTAGVGLSGGGDLTVPRTFDLEDTAVTPGSYVYAGFTVDQQGRITAAASGGAPALASITVTAGVGLDGGGDLSTPITLDLADTAVTPGSYAYGSFTVDQQGRLTAASDGAVPALASLSLTAGVGLTGGGDLTTARTFDLEDTAVTPGSYTNVDVTVDQQGRITAIADGGGGAASPLELDLDSLGNNDPEDYALLLANTTAATDMANQSTPALRFSGSNWDIGGEVAVPAYWNIFSQMYGWGSALKFNSETGSVFQITNDGRIYLPNPTKSGIDMNPGTSLGVSGSGSCRIRYDGGTNKLQVSLSGAAFVDIVTT